MENEQQEDTAKVNQDEKQEVVSDKSMESGLKEMFSAEKVDEVMGTTQDNESSDKSMESGLKEMFSAEKVDEVISKDDEKSFGEKVDEFVANTMEAIGDKFDEVKEQFSSNEKEDVGQDVDDLKALDVEAMLKDENTDSEMIDKIANSQHGDSESVQEAIADHQNTSKETLDELAQSTEFDSVKEKIEDVNIEANKSDEDKHIDKDIEALEYDSYEKESTKNSEAALEAEQSKIDQRYGFIEGNEMTEAEVDNAYRDTLNKFNEGIAENDSNIESLRNLTDDEKSEYVEARESGANISEALEKVVEEKVEVAEEKVEKVEDVKDETDKQIDKDIEAYNTAKENGADMPEAFNESQGVEKVEDVKDETDKQIDKDIEAYNAAKENGADMPEAFNESQESTKDNVEATQETKSEGITVNEDSNVIDQVGEGFGQIADDLFDKASEKLDEVFTKTEDSDIKDEVKIEGDHATVNENNETTGVESERVTDRENGMNEMDKDIGNSSDKVETQEESSSKVEKEEVSSDLGNLDNMEAAAQKNEEFNSQEESQSQSKSTTMSM